MVKSYIDLCDSQYPAKIRKSWVEFDISALRNGMELEKDSVAKHCQKVDHVKRLPAKEKQYKGKNSRKKTIKNKTIYSIKPY